VSASLPSNPSAAAHSSTPDSKPARTRAQFAHRIARAGELPAIVAIYNSTVASRMVTADTEPVSVASRQHWFDDHVPERRPLWVVEQDGAIIGWLSYSNFYGRPAYSGTAELSIYLHEAHRGKGLGRYLLAEAIAFAPRIKVHTLLGFIFGHNEPSLQLFNRFGFARWAEMPGVATLDGVERDLIILGKRVA
jgi:L-amino acid N-acyltransferase YncA